MPHHLVVRAADIFIKVGAPYDVAVLRKINISFFDTFGWLNTKVWDFILVVRVFLEHKGFRRDINEI